MRKPAIVLGGLLWSSCADVGSDARDDAGTVEPRAIAAPFVFEPAFDRLVLHDAIVDGRSIGELSLHGGAIEAIAGSLEGVPTEGEPMRGSAVAVRGEPGDEGLAFVDAAVHEVELVGIDVAWRADGTVIELGEPATIAASAFSWDDPGSQLVLLDAEHVAPAVAAADAGRRAILRERAHLLVGGGATPVGDGLGFLDAAADDEPEAAAMGELCTATEDCDGGLFCTQDPVAYPDGMDRCLALCVPPSPAMPLSCADDDACCDPNATCSDEGVCVPQTVDGGGGGDGGGCGNVDCDDDDDGVADGFDANPDESCSADHDADGCKDSCDGDDDDGGCGGGGSDDGSSGFCSTGRRRFPKPNALCVAFVLLVLLRGRRRWASAG